MKLITCRYNGAEHTAVVTHGDTQAVMTEDLGYHFRDMNDLIRKNFKVKKVTSSAKDGETVIISDAELDIPWAKKQIKDIGYEMVDYTSEPYEKKGLFHFGRK